MIDIGIVFVLYGSCIVLVCGLSTVQMLFWLL